ncbi:MAG: hypothetical protein M3Y72_25115, partial [Acidobacteriota bacterium]|nr:hypothetical protein [Acidobacteriota bacterium]
MTRHFRGLKFAPLCLLLSMAGFAQTTIRVPQDYPTIQAAVDAAQNGDTVLVSPGTYHENIKLNMKAITVTSGATSSAGAANTIISAPTADAT